MMRRRDVIKVIACAAAGWPLAARAQQQAMPVVGFLHSGTRTAPHDGFRQGLNETGFAEGRNVAIELRYAEGQYDRLQAMAAELVRQPVAVLNASGGAHTALAAKAATATLPIVFAIGSDPVKFGLVKSLNRPGGNITGVSFFTAELEAKRLGLLQGLVPQAAGIGVLVNPANANAQNQEKEVTEAARALGIQFYMLHASNDREIDAAFASLLQQRAGALLVASDPYFFARRRQLIALAARHVVAAIYEWREFAQEGGLMSYGTNLTDAYRQAGVYTGRILRGEKPADLPVLRTTKFEFVINFKTAKALGLNVPNAMQLLADEVIE
jgi:putative ABC transport system substrate-binding protein